MTHVIENSATIHAPPSDVWRALTDPDLMKQWIAEPVMRIEITTDWKFGSPIIVKGHHNNVDFENKGTILQFEPHSILRYSHLSSISRLPDRAQNYTILVQKYHVDLTHDADAILPRPLAVAAVILLLAIEGRQG